MFSLEWTQATEVAITLSVIIFLTLKVMTPLERALDEGEEPSPEG